MKVSPLLAAARKTIHAACRQLDIGEDTRRTMLETVTGHRSTLELDLAACHRVMDHLKTRGWKHQGQQPGQAHKPLAQSKESIERKIGWQLGQLGKEWTYAYGVAKRIFPDMWKFEFLTAEQLGLVSSALARTIRSKAK